MAFLAAIVFGNVGDGAVRDARRGRARVSAEVGDSGWARTVFRARRIEEGSRRDGEGGRGMGYQCVEFYAPYWDWSEAQTKEMRKLLDDLGVKCYSTHNASSNVTQGKYREDARPLRGFGLQVCGSGFDEC